MADVCCSKTEVVISQSLRHELRYIDKVWFADFDLLKTATSTNTKPEVMLGRCGRHLEKSIRRHIFVGGAPIKMKLSNIMQNKMPIAVM